jgi:hypothetical protein
VTRQRHPGAPWAAALGDRVEQLSPALQAYFGGVPYGAHGIGEGVFTTLGTPSVEPDEGGLRIASGRIGIRMLGLRWSLPAAWAPRVAVRERTLPDGRQHVALTIDAPLLGRMYEYSGAFAYHVEPALIA